MTNETPARVSFWRATLTAFRAFARNEWQWVATFSLLVALEELLVFPHFLTPVLIQQLNDAGNDTTKIFALIQENYPLILADSAVRMVTIAVGTYVFGVMFLRQVAPEAAIRFSPRSLGAWGYAMLRKYVVLTLPTVISSACVVLGVMHSDKLQTIPFAGDALVLTLIASVTFFFWAMFRLYIASPVALLGEAKALRQSWVLTKGHLFGIVWGLLVLILLWFAAYAIPLGFIDFFAKLTDMSKNNWLLLSAVAQGAFRGTMIVMTALYACVVYRMLNGAAYLPPNNKKPTV